MWFYELPVDPRNVFANWFISNTDPTLVPAMAPYVRAGAPWIQFQNDSPPWGNVLGLFARNDDNTAWTSMLSSGPVGPAGPTGPAGTDGIDGSTIRRGVGVPANGLGIDGDWYIDQATGNMYQKAAGVYSFILSIMGPSGVISTSRIFMLMGI